MGHESKEQVDIVDRECVERYIGISEMEKSFLRAENAQYENRLYVVRDRSYTVVSSLISEYLPWDSSVLGIPSAKLTSIRHADEYFADRRRLSLLFSTALEKQRQAGIRFVVARTPCNDEPVVHGLEDAGFRCQETYMSYRLDILGSVKKNTIMEKNEPTIQEARSDMVDSVANLADRVLVHNRYLNDPMIDNLSARESRRDWVRNSFNGRADAIYVAVDDFEVLGFVILRKVDFLSKNDALKIDLIGVDRSHQGRGIASRLVAHAINAYYKSAVAIIVGTQATNTNAINFYSSMGFKLVHSEYTFHWHDISS